MTITSSADATNHGLPSRLNLAESKLDWMLGQFPLTPPEPTEPPDLTALTNAVNWLYARGFAGSNISSPPLTYEDFYDLGDDASIISVTYGNLAISTDTGTHGRNLTSKSFWAQVFGTSNSNHDYPTRSGDVNLANLTVGDADSASYIAANGPSLQYLIFGRSFHTDTPGPADYPMEAIAAWGSLYKAIFGTALEFGDDPYQHTRSVLTRSCSSRCRARRSTRACSTTRAWSTRPLPRR